MMSLGVTVEKIANYCQKMPKINKFCLENNARKELTSAFWRLEIPEEEIFFEKHINKSTLFKIHTP